MSPDKRKALGRGLGALLPTPPPPPPPTVKRDYFVCGVEEIHPSLANPRQTFDEGPLAELVESIRAQGMIQPLVVRSRPPSEGGGFTLIAGERRWRAAQRAGLKEVPVVVKETTAAGAFEMALVENLQRQDLNAIEEADAYRRLSDEHGYTPEQLAARVGRDRSTIANALRLLRLPGSVRVLIASGRLAAGHARPLLGLDGDTAIEAAAKRVVDEGLSVRQVEALVARDKARRANPTEEPAPPRKSPNVRDLEARLERAIGARVQLHDKGGAGKLEIAYTSEAERERLLDRLLSLRA